MRTFTRLAALGAALVVIAPAALRGQEGIYVQDFATNPGFGPTVFNLTGPAQVRAGTTSTITITKNLIDLVPDQLIHASGGTIVGNAITHFRDSRGIGSISMKVTPAGGPGSTVTLNVGLTDHFQFSVLREGLITNVVFLPLPNTVPAGTPIAVNVSGAGLTGAQVKVSACHTVQAGPASDQALSATIRTTAGCSSSGPFQVTLAPSGPGEPRTYTKSSAQITFPFGPYLPTVACVSAPNLLAPTITSPGNGQLIKFTSGGSATQRVSFAWQNGIVPAPNGQFVVEVKQSLTRGTNGFTNVASVTLAQDTVRAFGASRTLQVPGTYTVTVRPLNCGAQPQPATSSHFTLSF